jgi:hypothetical protein
VRPEEAKQLLGDLIDWRPDGGVISAYVEIDPADRGEGWRISLREQLGNAPEPAADAVLRRFPENSPLPENRTHVGFVSADGEREVWHSFQAHEIGVHVFYENGPHLGPLIAILDDAWPAGIVLVALERVRVLEWAFGRVNELDGWELETTALDWRERKAPQRNPGADGTGTSASGREQHMQRIEHNREKFLKEAGGLVRRHYGERDWRELVVIGEGDRPKHLIAGLGAQRTPVHEINQDLIRASAAEVGERLEEELEHLNRSREEALVSQLEEAVGSDVGAALGPDEVVRALEEGRARHVIYAPDGAFEGPERELLGERLIQLAIATSAEFTPVEGFAAEALKRREGVAALLRY